ncbi:MAG: carboxymuconolactone decarboxylase family protein [Verrucomicrobia bacterium]|nr:carboxymuconolactone decarboxylase family protein [Verrucomicrobiota bacterium]
MKPRLNHAEADPGSLNAMLALEKYLAGCGIDPKLHHLVITRASQINGCAYCLDMHTRDARALGESEQRLHLLAAWRESPLFTDRERAALAWTEAVTLVSETGVPDEVYEVARAQFNERELVQLTLVIGAINTWNRLNVAFRTVHPVRAAQ